MEEHSKANRWNPELTPEMLNKRNEIPGNCHGQLFKEQIFQGDFRGFDFSECSFADCIFEGIFDHCNFSGANFDLCDLLIQEKGEPVLFRDCNFYGSFWNESRACSCEFAGSDFTETYMHRVWLDFVQFDDCDFKNVELCDMNLVRGIANDNLKNFDTVQITSHERDGEELEKLKQEVYQAFHDGGLGEDFAPNQYEAEEEYTSNTWSPALLNAQCETSGNCHGRSFFGDMFKGDFRDFDFSDCSFYDCAFEGAYSYCNFKGTKFEDCLLMSQGDDGGFVLFEHSDFSKTSWISNQEFACDFSGSDFTGSYMFNNHLKLVLFNDCDFANVELRDMDNLLGITNHNLKNFDTVHITTWGNDRDEFEKVRQEVYRAFNDDEWCYPYLQEDSKFVRINDSAHIYHVIASTTLDGNTFYLLEDDENGREYEFGIEELPCIITDGTGKIVMKNVRKGFEEEGFPDCVEQYKKEKSEREQKALEEVPYSDDMRQVIHYLHKVEGIDRGLIRRLIAEGTLKEHADTHEVVFLGKDEKGKVRYIKGSYGPIDEIKGSMAEYAFSIKGTTNQIRIFDDEMDMLRYMTINPKCKDTLLMGSGSMDDLEARIRKYPQAEKIVMQFTPNGGNDWKKKYIEERFQGRYGIAEERPKSEYWFEDLADFRKQQRFFKLPWEIKL